MTILFKDDGGVDRTISEVLFKDDGGTDRTISEIRHGANIVYSTAPDLTVVVAPDSVGGDAGLSGSATSTTAYATPSGGTAPYTYLWTIEDEIGGTITVDAPTASSTTFSVSGIPTSEFWTGTGRCTVTDANSFTADDTVSVAFSGGF